MATVSTLAIIGACSERGRSVLTSLRSKKIRLLLADDDTDALGLIKQEAEQQSGGAVIEVMDCITEAGWEADIIVLALNWQAEKETFLRIKPFITGKTVISFSKDNNCLLPYSRVIAIRPENESWLDEMETELSHEI